MTPIRPEFDKPPIIERAIVVSFEQIESLSLGDYGLFWATIRDEFPVSEAHPPVSVEIEEFGGFRPAQLGIELLSANALPRAFFRNDMRGELVQVQGNRFGFNWIKIGDDHAYPRSEATLLRFFELLARFQAFLAERGIGPVVPVQYEITNVNVIPVGDFGGAFADAGMALNAPSIQSEAPFLKLESIIFGSKHVISDDAGNAVGRVHCVAQPSLKMSDNSAVHRLDITARGMPSSVDQEDVNNFFVLAGSAINAVFLASVTERAKQFWGEK